MPIWLPGIVHADQMGEGRGASGRVGQLLVAGLVVVGVLGLTALALRLEGRFAICACGEVYLWSGDISSSDNSQHIADPYTLTHLLHGVMFCWLLSLVARDLAGRWQFVGALILESVWEVVENSSYVIDRYREATIALGYQGDTIINSMGDIAVCGVGFALARRVGVGRSVAVFLLTEVLLLVWIRDSLILNIIMLLYRSETILNWQMR